jgi:allophanate hydrolase
MSMLSSVLATGLNFSLDFKSLRSSYESGHVSPRQVTSAIFDMIDERGDDGVWTYLVPRAEALARADQLESMDPGRRKAMRLYGLPFSVKDCVDVAGAPTSSACPALAYTADKTNPAIERLLEAGAIFVGKTNMDQFATGLVGVRTPYGVSRNPFDPEYIPGGSSSGAAVSVASGLVSFGIGTDTGGSGRVPASCNNVVGLKPTRGLMSTSNMVAANKSLDCLSVYALTCADSIEVLETGQDYDQSNPFSRPEPESDRRKTYEGGAFCFGIPAAEHREFFGNTEARDLFDAAVEVLTAMGGRCKEIDYTPFKKVGKQLFDGPWVAERLASLRSVAGDNSDPLSQLLPITRKVIAQAGRYSATDYFEALYEVKSLRKQIEPLWSEIDVLALPTTATIYRIAEVEADPINLNRNMGYYTYFLNLFDLTGIAVPNGFLSNGLPAGITLNGPAFTDHYLAGLGAEFQRKRGNKLGATPFNLP